MKVRDVMSKPARTCAPQASASEAAKIMWDGDVGCVPVVDEQGAPLGIVTDRDLCMAAYTRAKPLHELSVESVMSRAPRTCRQDDSIHDAETIMADAQVRRLPVVDDFGDVIGMVSLGDLARARTRTPIDRIADHVLADVSKTLAAITRPRRAEAALASDGHGE